MRKLDYYTHIYKFLYIKGKSLIYICVTYPSLFTKRGLCVCNDFISWCESSLRDQTGYYFVMYSLAILLLPLLRYLSDRHANNHQHRSDVIYLPYVTYAFSFHMAQRINKMERVEMDNGLEISRMKYEMWLIVGRLDFLFPRRRIIRGTYSTCRNRQVFGVRGWRFLGTE